MIVSIGVEVSAPPDAVWRELVDLDAWPQWGPTVRAATLDDGSRRLHAGATGSVQTAVGVWLPFVVDGWVDGWGDDEERYWSWRVGGVPATRHGVRPTAPGSCRLEMAVPWWAPGYLAVVAVALRRVRRRAEDAGRAG